MCCVANSQKIAIPSAAMHTSDVDSRLDRMVLEQLNQCRGEWRAVASSAGVSHSWISQFVRGKIPNPGFNTLLQLHRHLSEREQAVEPKAEGGPGGLQTSANTTVEASHAG